MKNNVRDKIENDYGIVSVSPEVSDMRTMNGSLQTDKNSGQKTYKTNENVTKELKSECVFNSV